MGYTLEEIDLIFRESPSIWATVRYAKQNPHHDLLENHSEKSEVEHEENSEKAIS